MTNLEFRDMHGTIVRLLEEAGMRDVHVDLTTSAAYYKADHLLIQATISAAIPTGTTTTEEQA